jgi:adenylate cyclase
VNLASRLESANKLYGTTIIASEATMTLTGSAFTWREIDTIRVKGRISAFKIFEPLGAAGAASPEQTERADAYAEGLARFRARDFAGAANAFALSAGDDPPSALFMARAEQLARCPPGQGWEPINTLEEK